MGAPEVPRRTLGSSSQTSPHHAVARRLFGCAGSTWEPKLSRRARVLHGHRRPNGAAAYCSTRMMRVANEMFDIFGYASFRSRALPCVLVASMSLYGGCDKAGPTPTETPTLVAASLHPSDTIVTIGRQFDYVVLDARGSSVRLDVLEWSTSAPEHAFMLAPGTIYAGASGESTIRATNAGGSVHATVRVAPFVDVSVGLDSGCALREGGRFACWGRHPRYTLGPAPGEYVRMSAVGRDFVRMDNTDQVSCAVTRDGRLFCWGSYPQPGMLWNPDLLEGPTLDPVEVTTGYNFVDVAVAWSSACALTNLGRVVCWGTGFPAVGQGPIASILTPIPPGEVVGDQVYTMIAADGRTHCGLTTNRTVECWGEAPSERFDGRQFDWVGVFRDEVCAIDSAGNAECDAFDELTRPTLSLQRVASNGQGRYCGIADGVLWCWDSTRPPSGVTVSHRFDAIEMGDEHQCALSVSGRVACWGRNGHGQAGYEPFARSTFWVDVP